MRRRLFLAVLALAATPGVLHAADDDKKKKAGGPDYIGIDTLTGTTNKANGRRGVLTVECGLNVPNGDLREKAKELLPVLRAAYVQTVIVYAAGLPFDAVPNADYLEMTMQRQTDEILGQPGARFLVGAILVN